jgi:mRNA-degrading endonuclease YafQ of YafQ-DinJ toxin-antitoxin module
MPWYLTLQLSGEFMESLLAREAGDFSRTEHRRFLRAMRLLDDNERLPSLRVHELQGDLAGLWSASASDQLRIVFRRLPNGREELLQCSRHYDR